MQNIAKPQKTTAELYKLVNHIRKNSWEYSIKPFQILDNIYYVGNKWVAAYLIDTGDGLILIDSNFDDVMWILFDNIRAAGFDPADIKILLLTHGHFDHIGGARYIQEVSHCKTYYPRADLFMLNERRDLLCGNVPEFKIDEFYDYNKKITLGNTSIQPIHSPGHTCGCTSLAFTSQYKGKLYEVAAHGGLGSNGLTHKELVKAKLPVDLQQRYLRNLQELAKRKVDVFIPLHNGYYDILALRKLDKGNHAIFIQPDIWGRTMQEKYQLFQDLLKKEEK